VTTVPLKEINKLVLPLTADCRFPGGDGKTKTAIKTFSCLQKLSQPFQSLHSHSFYAAAGGQVSVTIYDLNGRRYAGWGQIFFSRQSRTALGTA
jgi:hypothetical protein